MPRRPLNVSAALAIAIERQVEDIIANAKTECALHIVESTRSGLLDPTVESAAFAPQSPFEVPETDGHLDEAAALFWVSQDGQDIDPPLQPQTDFKEPAPSVGERARGGRLDFWKRLRFLWASRSFRG